jgi:hypothetical protein
MTAAGNLVGKRFGRLLVKARAGSTSAGAALWHCLCDCGHRHIARGGDLRAGKIKSCGCLMGNVRHGGHGTPEYRAWMAMKTRCSNPRTIGWKNYGGRGIKVHDRWLTSFEMFLEDMGRKPTSRHTLERVNNALGYSPNNCAWATYQQQAQNKRPHQRRAAAPAMRSKGRRQ